MSESKWLFLHIEKTGGETVRGLFERNYPREAYYRYYGNIKPHRVAYYKSLPPARKNKIQFIIGHFDFGLHEHLGIQRPRYLTILRNPADKVISFYHHIRRDPVLWSMPRVREMSLEEYVTAGFHRQGDNGQVRRLSGTTQLAVGEIGKQHAEKAKKNLERWFSVVGLLERFDETLVLLKNQNLLTNLHYLKKNVFADLLAREQIPKRAIRIIEKYNRWDIELYDFARELFEKQVAHCPAGFAGEVKTAGRENRQYEEFYLNYTQGLEFFENNQWAESKHCFEQCFEPGTGMSEFPGIAAKIYFYLGEIAKDSDGKTWNTYFQKSLETVLNKKYPTDEDIYLIGSLFKGQGNYVESKKWFETLLVDSGFNDFIAGVYFHLGEIHLEMGQKEEAVHSFRKASGLNPRHRRAGEYLARMEL
jgi:tetratricopeptide (TPR) repeat protein